MESVKSIGRSLCHKSAAGCDGVAPACCCWRVWLLAAAAHGRRRPWRPRRCGLCGGDRQIGQWKPGKCLCVGHFREEAVEDFPAGLLDTEFARFGFLRQWSTCAPYYGMVKKPKGCGAGLTEFICSVSERTDLPKYSPRALPRQRRNEAMQKGGIFARRIRLSARRAKGYRVHPVSLKGSGKIHE